MKAVPQADSSPRASSVERLLSIAVRMREREGIEGLILGGTELPLILRDDTHGGIPFLDTTRIHVNAAVAQL
jgi:aspartate racemase